MSSPLRSMTGFGSAAREKNDRRARVTLRTVNQRTLRLNLHCRLPLGPREKELRDLVAASFTRGNVDLSVELAHTGLSSEALFNPVAAQAVIKGLRVLAQETGLSEADIRPADALRVPDVCQASQDDELSDADWALLRETLCEALHQADQMRITEGAATVAVLRDHVAAVDTFRTEATTAAPEAVKRQKQRLTDRIDELRQGPLGPIDQAAIEREVVFFADRSDICEEVDRLKSHVAQFGEVLDRGGEAGKRLDFLAQEMLREVNTIASKGNHTRIAAMAVDAKLAVEKIKEQAANLE